LEPDNPWYPLPADYEELTAEGQRQARIAAVCRQRTPLEFVAAWDTFRRLYLMPTEPGFFYHKLAPSPPFHYEMIHAVGQYGRNLFAAPRGFAKSIVIGTELPLFLSYTRPNIRLVLCLATDTMVETRFADLTKQYVENELLQADFGPMKPPRGKGIWNKHEVHTLRGTKIRGFSVTGRKRGARPDLFILDDPEYDENQNSDTAGLVTREKFENFLFQQVVPMLEKGSGAVWVGTVIGRQSFLSYALAGEDSRFSFWNKVHFRSGDPDAEDPERRKLLWEANWDADTLRIRKEEIGPEAFAKEYMNEVGTGMEKAFDLDDKKNFYLVEQPDDIYAQNPLQSVSRLSYHVLEPDKGYKWTQREEAEARQFFSRLYVLLTVDVAQTISRHSDFSCVCASGFDTDNCLWILDMWLGRAPREQVLNHIFRLGYKWQARVIGIESCGTQIEVVDAAKTMLEDRRISGWEPRVVPVDYTQTKDRAKKAQRIATLEWRFRRGKIKFPANWKHQWPWKELFAEINDFTYDLSMLAHDDAIDAVAMNHYVIHGRGAQEMPQPARHSLADQIAAGDLWVPGGIPRISGMRVEDFTSDVLEAMVSRAYQLGHHGRQRPFGHRAPYIPLRTKRKERQHYGASTPQLDSGVVSVGGHLCRRSSSPGDNLQHPNLAGAFPG